MIRGGYSGVGGREVDKHQQTKRVDMSRRMRRAQPKSAMRSIRVAIGAGPQHSLTRAPADDHAARGEFSRVRHPHLLFSCIFRSPPPARRRRSSRNRAAVLRMSAAADDCPFRREIHSPSGISAAVDAGSRRRCVRGVAPGSREFSPLTHRHLRCSAVNLLRRRASSDGSSGFPSAQGNGKRNPRSTLRQLIASVICRDHHREIPPRQPLVLMQHFDSLAGIQKYSSREAAPLFRPSAQ